MRPVCLCFLVLANTAPVFAAEAALKEARQRWLHGNYEEARELYQAAAKDTQQHDAAIIGVSRSWESQGEYDKAAPRYKRALAMLERALGPKHPDVVASLNNLASLYYNQGRYDKAEPLLLEAADGWRKSCGDDHPETLAALGNLGSLYQRQGRDDEAEPQSKNDYGEERQEHTRDLFQ